LLLTVARARARQAFAGGRGVDAMAEFPDHPLWRHARRGGMDR
jgi:hypothetical protein